MPTDSPPSRKLLSYSDLRELGIEHSRWTLHRLEKLGQFPRRVHLSPKTVCWIAEEIERHIAEKAAARKFLDGEPPLSSPAGV